MDCLFCKIINNEISSYCFYEDDIVKVFLDINQDDAGHYLVICKEHYVDLFDIPNDIRNHIFDVAKKTALVVKEKLDCQGFTLVQNNGIAEDVKHFHLHVIPKYNKKRKMTIEEVYNLIKK